MINKDFFQALDELEQTKGISKDYFIEAFALLYGVAPQERIHYEKEAVISASGAVHGSADGSRWRNRCSSSNSDYTHN